MEGPIPRQHSCVELVCSPCEPGRRERCGEGAADNQNQNKNIMRKRNFKFLWYGVWADPEYYFGGRFYSAVDVDEGVKAVRREKFECGEMSASEMEEDFTNEEILDELWLLESCECGRGRYRVVRQGKVRYYDGVRNHYEEESEYFDNLPSARKYQRENGGELMYRRGKLSDPDYCFTEYMI